MNADKIAAVAGTLGLVHGGFGHTEDAHETKLGAMASRQDKVEPSAPMWASLRAIAIGNMKRLLHVGKH